MVYSGTLNSVRLACFVALPVMAALVVLPPAQAQGADIQVESDITDPNNTGPLTQEDSLLSMPGGERMMQEATNAIDSGNYSVAAKKLQEARQIFNQLSNFYQQLASSFSGIDNRVYESQRQKALETAEKRDEATYRLALVHRANDQPELAVPLLIQIIRSQNPTRELGKKSYQQLFELGFVDSPFPRNGNSQPTSSAGSNKGS
ncbi:MAG: hypothetical protein F6J94_21545 [Moorea sp. SIO1F2]|uniref:hypothetical protein n=1 Tax=unclassified Moorena TaxID=2683338 RepID=UPI0013BD567B|nr:MULTISPECIES: hypothetical protein [unclassified Moorena]NEO03676.1 hypothetical protein [Moorena sp. SIO3I7]NEO64088.1 hypothetical protein [Moorena sp. SIO4G2]NEO06880.1 hypothetical protein [Moorena sp. SIO3I8]NEO17007.1 hypothetical protein [Moorena sp. SIO3E8]NEO22475.1 hypothetical protein [Moorena sp. SIO4A5]